jgi:hypothetical protein
MARSETQSQICYISIINQGQYVNGHFSHSPDDGDSRSLKNWFLIKISQPIAQEDFSAEYMYQSILLSLFLFSSVLLRVCGILKFTHIVKIGSGDDRSYSCRWCCKKPNKCEQRGKLTLRP